MFTAVLFIITKIWKNLCPETDKEISVIFKMWHMYTIYIYPVKDEKLQFDFMNGTGGYHSPD